MKVVAIGNFDGVHRGHQSVLQAARQIAGDATVSALTFWPHPLSVLNPSQVPPLLSGITDRVELLRQAGANEVLIVEFTDTVGSWSPEQFVERVLDSLQADAVVVGQNFHFGAGARADGHQMRELAQGRFDVTVLDMLCDDGPVSSSRIRAAVRNGDPKLAAQMLGRWFCYSGLVILGDQRGRMLGFPTANLAETPGGACFADAVYAGYLTHAENRWPAAISVGSNPTFSGQRRHVEAHAIGHDDLNLYGARVGVEFVARLRDQTRFDSREALIDQLKSDVEATQRVLAESDSTI